MGVWCIVGMLGPPSLRLRVDNLLMTYSFVCWSGFLLDKQEWHSQAPIWGLFPLPVSRAPVSSAWSTLAVSLGSQDNLPTMMLSPQLSRCSWSTCSFLEWHLRLPAHLSP